MRRLERVRAWPLKDRDGHRWLVVEISAGRVVHGAKPESPDVTHTYQSAFVGALDQHIFELPRVGEAAQKLDADFVGALLSRRRAIQHTSGDLHVLTAKRLHNFAGGQAERGNTIWIEPDPHRVFACADQPDIADAIEPSQT